MIRVTQMLGRGFDFATEQGAEWIRGRAGEGFRVGRRTLGARDDEATRNGAPSPDESDNWPKAADLIHAWDEPALLSAAMGPRRPIVFSPVAPPRRSSLRWLRTVARLRDLWVVCPSETLRRAWTPRVVSAVRCEVIRPGVEGAAFGGNDTRALRRPLGFAADDRVILAPGETTRAAGHDLAAWATAIANIVDPRFKLLVWGTRGGIGTASAAGRQPRRGRRVRRRRAAARRAVTFAELLGAADAAAGDPA
jgi:hypothetical protein